MRIRCRSLPRRCAIHANKRRTCGQVPRVWATTPWPARIARPIRHTCVACTSGVRSRTGGGRRARAHQLRDCPESMTRTPPAHTGAVSSPCSPYRRFQQGAFSRAGKARHGTPGSRRSGAARAPGSTSRGRGWSSPGLGRVCGLGNETLTGGRFGRDGGSPAAGPPLGSAGRSRPSVRVLAVAGVEPGGVREPVENAFLDIGEGLLEAGRVAPGVADATGEQAVAGEQVRAVGQSPPASYSSAIEPGVWPRRWMASSDAWPTRTVSAVLHGLGDRLGQRLGVAGMRDGRGAGGAGPPRSGPSSGLGGGAW